MGEYADDAIDAGIFECQEEGSNPFSIRDGFEHCGSSRSKPEMRERWCRLCGETITGGADYEKLHYQCAWALCM